LPEAWHSGSIQGICARGGFEISMKWKDGTLSSVKVLSKAGKTCRLNYNGKMVALQTSKGGVYSFDSALTEQNEL